jgi:serine/threonine protein kinase
MLPAKLEPTALIDLYAQQSSPLEFSPWETNPMQRPLWDRIQEIYYLTLPVARSERSAYLAGACNNDPLLVREVASLLHADDTADGFLESPVFELGLKVISSSNRDQASISTAELGGSLVGKAIGERYLVESELGHGGIGKVYLARDLTLHHRKVVMKVLLDASLADPYVVTKFHQEVEALSRIDHPNVVSVLGAGELPDGKPYIVMQYVDGVTLRSQIPTEGMDLERAALILKQMGAALEDVHEQRIFHRDLKPENILIQFLKGGTEWVKIVDFGIAKVKDSVVAPSTANKVSVGTVLYMSPEQLRGGERITAASDIYSMGIIAYEMITGRRPFNPSSAPQLLEMHREGVRLNPIDLRPNLSTEARAILLRALSFDPAARYQNAVQFGDHLARALTEGKEPIKIAPRYPVDVETIGSRGPSNPTTPVVLQRTNPRLKYLIGTLLIVFVGITIAIYLGTKPSTRPENQVSATPQPTPPERSFNYSLDVQKMRGGKPYQAAYLSTGKEIFETGYKFRLNVSSPEPGFLYVFNEGEPSTSGTSFTILHPLPSTNHGSATLGSNQLVQTGWYEFADKSGTENFWIVWSTSQIPELEAAKTAAFKHPDGGLTGDILAATKKFLIAKKEEVKTKYSTNKETHQTKVYGNGDVLVRMVEFQHR